MMPLFPEMQSREVQSKKESGRQLLDTIERHKAVSQRRTELVKVHEKALHTASECWETDRDLYWACIHNMQVAYTLLVLLSDSTRDEVESLRLNTYKEILKVEREMQQLDNKLAVTRGSSTVLVEEAYALGCRQLRLYDQLEALKEALR